MQTLSDDAATDVSDRGNPHDFFRHIINQSAKSIPSVPVLRGIPVIEIELEREMLVRIEETQEQAMKTTEPTMTESQRDEVKRLCHEADVPDKSGELLTEEGARHFIADLRKQIAARND